MNSSIINDRKRLFPKCLYHSFIEPLLVENGNAQYYNDNNILDLYNNVCHVGHSNEKILETIKKEYATININTRYLNKNLQEYGKHLYRYIQHLPKKYKMVFVNSGSEANDLALRISLIYRNKGKIVSLKDSYHGTTFLCDMVSHLYPTGIHKNKYDDNVIFIDRDNFYLEQDNISSIIMETIQGVAGNIPLSKKFVTDLFKFAEKERIITICDEVQTGFGRTGHTFWAFEHFNVIPDIITCGKPIANGYPMGAVIIREDIADLLGDFYFNTFGGNSVACAVANTVLSELETNNYIENSKVLGDYLKEQLSSIKEISNITGRGLYIGFTVNNSKELVENLKENNIIVGIGYNNIVRIKPPIIVNKENIDHFIYVLKTLI